MFVVVAALFITNCGGGNGGADDSDNVPLSYDCSVFPDQDTSAYSLPYEVGSSFTAFPHAARTTLDSQNAAERGQYYAVDIPMPIGTPIVASRSGTVVRIEEQYIDGDNQAGHENLLIVKHDDGTFSRYWHLTQEGALVSVADQVLQQERIATSGNTGNSTEAHLHFDVVDESCDPDSDVNTDLRTCQALPVTFRNTRSLECGLEFGGIYTALSL